MRRRKADLSDWHLFNFGSRRMALFRDEQDANVFLGRVRTAAGLAGCVVWAYTLMTNHFHLVARATSDQLHRFMHHLQRLYSLYHNRRYNLKGHAFAGPYGAVSQAGRAMLSRTLAYVFTNPVTAYLVENCAAWPWTSYRSFMGIGESRLWINAIPLLAELDPDLQTARRKVLYAVEKAVLKRRNRPPAQEPTTTEVHREHFEWLLETAEERAGMIGRWKPVYLALLWARDIGIFRGAIAKALGGPLGPSMRSEFQAFRKWLATKPLLAESLRIP